MLQRLLLDISSTVDLKQDNFCLNSSHTFKQCLTDGVTAQVYLDITDDTFERRHVMIKSRLLTYNNPTQIYGFIKESHTIDGIDDDNLTSNF